MNLYLLGYGFAGFVFTLTIIVLRARGEIHRAKCNRYDLIRLRLSVYALMKFPCATIFHPADKWPNFVPSCMLLTQDQHDILLGVLKKIEAKSAMIAAVFVFGLGVAAGLLKDAEGVSCQRSIQSIICGVLAAMVLASLNNAAHLGQPHFRRLYKKTDRQVVGRELQRSLIEDALVKESIFSSLYGFVVLVAILFFVSFLVAA